MDWPSSRGQARTTSCSGSRQIDTAFLSRLLHGADYEGALNAVAVVAALEYVDELAQFINHLRVGRFIKLVWACLIRRLNSFSCGNGSTWDAGVPSGTHERTEKPDDEMRHGPGHGGGPGDKEASPTPWWCGWTWRSRTRGAATTARCALTPTTWRTCSWGRQPSSLGFPSSTEARQQLKQNRFCLHFRFPHKLKRI